MTVYGKASIPNQWAAEKQRTAMTTVSINLKTLIQDIEQSNPEGHKELLSWIITDDAVIKSISEQIIRGIDDAGNSGSTNGDLWTTDYPTPLQIARRFIKTLAPAAVQHELELLAEQAKSRLEECNHFKQQFYQAQNQRDEARRTAHNLTLLVEDQKKNIEEKAKWLTEAEKQNEQLTDLIGDLRMELGIARGSDQKP